MSTATDSSNVTFITADNTLFLLRVLIHKRSFHLRSTGCFPCFCFISVISCSMRDEVVSCLGLVIRFGFFISVLDGLMLRVELWLELRDDVGVMGLPTLSSPA